MATALLAALLTPPLAAANDAAVENALIEAQASAADNDHAGAVRWFKKADKAAEGTSVEALVGLARALNKLGAHKDAAEAARRGLALDSVDLRDEAGLQHELGMGLYFRAGDDLAALEDAAGAFERILELTEGEEPTTIYNLARLRIKQGRDDEGIALLQTYLDLAPRGPYADDARALIETPKRGRVNMVPDVDLVTLDGELMTFDDLKGRVVVVDFWATWCRPCIAALPALRRLSKRSAKSPFTLISISTDGDRGVVEEAIREHRMTWPQVWDQRHQQARAFNVQSYPTYLVIDHEGVIVYRGSGWGSATERQLASAVAKALRKARKAAG